MKNKAPWLIGLCCIIGLIGYKLVVNKQKIEEKEKPINTDLRIPVTIAPVTAGMEQTELSRTGMLIPFQEATVIAPGSGNIVRLMFKLGDNVKKGQLLALLDTRIAKLELQKAVSAATKLKNDLQTYTELLEGNAATQEKVNQVRQDYNDALNRVSQLKRQIADAAITAPISGIISMKKVEDGVFAPVGAEIATIVNLDKLKLNISLTEQEVYTIHTGKQVFFTTSVYPEKSFTGTVNFISPKANEANNYIVEITALNNTTTPLKAGTFVAVNLSDKTQRKIILIPRSALIEGTENASVYIAVNGKAQLQKIVTGRAKATQIEVLDGLSAGSQVITSGQINLHNGSLTRTTNN